MKLPNKRRYYSFAYAIGASLFLLCTPYDWFFCYERRWEMFAARVGACLCFGLGIVLFRILSDRWLDPLATVLVTVAGVGVSVLAVIEGKGFASPVYAGHFIAIMAFSLLFQLKTWQYATGLALVLTQHFVMLWFVPSPPRFLVLHLLALPVCSLLGVITHHIIHTLIIRTHTLEGFLPICARCKKIRDDKGYWNQIEEYIRSHSEAEFTHSLCEECAEEHYGYRKKRGTSGHTRTTTSRHAGVTHWF
jgi:hypothetical protein